MVVKRFLGEYQGGSDKARRITKIKKENLIYKVGIFECKNLESRRQIGKCEKANAEERGICSRRQ